MKCPACQTENPDTSRFCGNCATALRPQEEIPFSKTLTLETPFKALDKSRLFAGKYKILGEIGRGGMGVVLGAEDTRLKRTVALKFLPAELTGSREARERFIREAQAAAALDHPHICTIYEAEEYEGQAYIAMAYIEGESLRKKIAKGPLATEEALEIGTQVAEGLEEAHKKGIIHRDVKSANIMVTEKGLAKVMDFGLAKVLGESLITREAKAMGTAAYMSPEQAQGQSVDHRTDIWSLGIVLYEMLTGQLPFGGEGEASLLYSIVHRAHPPMRKIVPKVSPELERVVGKALAKNPADRYQSMGELLEDLRAIAEGLKPVRAGARLFQGRILGLRKVYVYSCVAVLAALVTFGIFALFPGRTEALDSIAILPFVNDSKDSDQDYFADNLTDMLIADLFKISGLEASPRQSVMVYKKSNKPLKQIAKELNVKAVVEASVLISGNRIRVIARLIDPIKNKQIWAEKFERETSDYWFLLSDLSQAIANGINIAVTPAEKELLARAHKVNQEANELYQKGYYEYNYVYPPSMDSNAGLKAVMRAIDYFKKAIEVDSNFALAYAHLGLSYWELGVTALTSEKDVYAKAKAAFMKALELDEKLALAHLGIAVLRETLDWDFPGAEREFKRALEIEPGNYQIQYQYILYLQSVGRFDEAIARGKPLEESAPKELPFLKTLAAIYLQAGRYDEALEAAKKEAGSHPSFYNSILAHAYAYKGMYPEALSIIDKMMASPGAQDDWLLLGFQATFLALSGRRENALKTIEKIKVLWAAKNVDYPFHMATIYAALGDNDQVFKLLYEAYEAHYEWMFTMKTYPAFHHLHGDPRFKDLLKKIGLE